MHIKSTNTPKHNPFPPLHSDFWSNYRQTKIAQLYSHSIDSYLILSSDGNLACLDPDDLLDPEDYELTDLDWPLIPKTLRLASIEGISGQIYILADKLILINFPNFSSPTASPQNIYNNQKNSPLSHHFWLKHQTSRQSFIFSQSLNSWLSLSKSGKLVSLSENIDFHPKDFDTKHHKTAMPEAKVPLVLNAALLYGIQDQIHIHTTTEFLFDLKDFIFHLT